MNNLQHIVKDNTRFAMHVAVELCEQGDFDSVAEAFRWLMKEHGSGMCNPVETATLENVTAHVMECDKCGGTYEHVNGVYEHCPRCGRRWSDDLRLL